MKFGSHDNPESLDLSLPRDHPETKKNLSKYGEKSEPEIYVGCAKWNRSDLKNFYPQGTKDELEYYGTQFNAIELNATFYNIYDKEQITEWHDKVPGDFKFFPKVNQYISHLKWLNGIEERTDDFIDSIVHFKEKLGTTFLQLRGNFAPKFIDRIAGFIEHWPDGIPLAIECRHTNWFNDDKAASEFHALLQENNIANVLVDTAGRRDIMHMRLTNNEAFIRYVGANHESDYTRLDEWVERLGKWHNQGLENIHFFVHQNKEKASPKLAGYFINKLNKKLGTKVRGPKEIEQGDLF
ncbi:MAG: DUF72 domain-containing protein [Balneolaceae bacterium]|nr:DUF72 domain-containing protein [Balneolaceae bacterium]